MLKYPDLLAALDYDPLTGVFVWRVARGRVTVGSVAGCPGGQGSKYCRIRIDKKQYYAHTLAWFYVHRVWIKGLDHKDRNGHNNAIDNLRLATIVQNAANASVRKDSRLGVKGVRIGYAGKYEARVRFGGKEKTFSGFSTIEEASAAYVKEAANQQGEFASGGFR
jgi:hypothetical protein